MLPCDVTDEASVDLANSLREKWGKLDFLVHAIAYSDKEELKGGYIETTRQNFHLDVSVIHLPPSPDGQLR